jgi:ParB-like chromosome segregation protein Spo0J
MKVEKIQINKLKPATYNPRQISKKQYNDLKDSIVKFGLVDPIILNKDFTVIGGHQRLKVCKELKYKDIDCVVLDLTKEDERELNTLDDSDKSPFQQMSFTLADKQVEFIKNKINHIKKTEEFNYIETFGNENSNGNALYLLISQWVEQKK